MSKFLMDLGLGISIINVYYSLAYFLMWCVALQRTYDDGDNEPFVWLAVYMGNVFLNAILFLGLRKRDRWAVIVWFSLTLLWFVPKLYDHKRGCRLDEQRGSMYVVINLIMESYVILSFAIMILVYRDLSKYIPRKRNVHAKNEAPQDIQMEDLGPIINGTDKVEVQVAVAKEETKECLLKGKDQQSSSFEFHRADEGSKD